MDAERTTGNSYEAQNVYVLGVLKLDAMCMHTLLLIVHPCYSITLRPFITCWLHTGGMLHDMHFGACLYYCKDDPMAQALRWLHVYIIRHSCNTQIISFSAH